MSKEKNFALEVLDTTGVLKIKGVHSTKISDLSSRIKIEWEKMTKGYFNVLPILSQVLTGSLYESAGCKSANQYLINLIKCSKATASELVKVASIFYVDGQISGAYECLSYTQLVRLTAHLDSDQMSKFKAMCESEYKLYMEDKIAVGDKLDDYVTRPDSPEWSEEEKLALNNLRIGWGIGRVYSTLESICGHAGALEKSGKPNTEKPEKKIEESEKPEKKIEESAKPEKKVEEPASPEVESDESEDEAEEPASPEVELDESEDEAETFHVLEGIEEAEEGSIEDLKGQLDAVSKVLDDTLAETDRLNLIIDSYAFEHEHVKKLLDHFDEMTTGIDKLSKGGALGILASFKKEIADCRKLCDEKFQQIEDIESEPNN